MTSPRLVCGVLDTSREVRDAEASSKARSLTISGLRWGFSGNIVEGKSVNEILDRAQEAGYDYCFLQAYGHIVTEQWSPQHDESMEFFHLLRHWIETTNFFVTGHIVRTGENYGLLSRSMLVNLFH